MKTMRLALLAVLALLPLTASAVNYPLLNWMSSPTDTVVTADGAVWVSSNAGLHRLDRGSGTFAKITTNYFEDLIIGPDGAVWATGLQQLYRIDPANLSVQPFPFPGEAVTMFAAGPDGMLWLALSDRVARMTPAGTIVSSVASVEPDLPGPGANLVTNEGWWWLHGWFTGKLELITPSGASQTFTIDVPIARWMLSGGDFLWIVGFNGDVARVGLNGAVLARYKPAQQIVAAAVDAEGDLWFREGNQLFQLTRDGVETAHDSLPFVECQIPWTSYIAFGPAGETVVTTAYDLNLIGVLPPCQPGGSSEVVTHPPAEPRRSRARGSDRRHHRADGDGRAPGHDRCTKALSMNPMRIALLAVLTLLPLSASAVNYPLSPFSSPTDMVVTADGAVWVSSGSGLYRLDRGFGTFSKVTAMYFDNLLVAADGAVWAMELGAGSVFRIDPATLSVQPFPFPGEPVNMMAAGPDGMIWLSIGGGGDPHRIARMTPAGNVVSSVAAAVPDVQGPGSNVVTAEGWWWQGPWASGRIDLITPAGTTQSFTVDVPRAIWIVSGGDFLWVVGQLGDVAKVGLNGAVLARYKPAQEPWNVAVDGEGDLWFREGDQLFQLTGDGVQTAEAGLPHLPCFLPTNSYIAFGPAGEIVVTTAYNLSLIGVLPPCEPSAAEVVTILPSHAGAEHEIPTAGTVALMVMAGLLALAGVFLTRS